MKKYLVIVFLSVLTLVFAAGTADAGLNVGLLTSSGGSYFDELVAFLTNSYFIDSITVIDIHSSTPALAALQDFDVIVIHEGDHLNSPSALGDVLADYVDLGGKGLVLPGASSADVWSILGRLNSDGYKPIVNGANDNTTDLYIGSLVYNIPVTAGITSLYEWITTKGTLASGATSLGTFNDGTTLLGAYKGSVVQLNFYYGGGFFMRLQESELLLNAIYYAAGLMTSWETKAAVPAEQSYAATVSDGRYIYVLGGYRDESDIFLPQNTSYRYDPQTNSWDTMAPMPVSLAFLQAVYVDGKIYVPGGWDRTTPYNCKVYIYNIAGNSWTTVNNECAHPSAGYSAVYSDGYIYRMGGHTSAPDYFTTVDRFLINTNTWQSVASMNSAHADAAAWARNGKIYIAGGRSASTTSNLVCEAYNPAGNTWSTSDCADLMGERWAGGAVFYNGLLFFAGGSSVAFYTPFNNAIVYDPVTDIWQPWPTLMNNHSVGNNVAVVGGMLHTLNGYEEAYHEATPICYPYQNIFNGDSVDGDTTGFGSYYDHYAENPARDESGGEAKYRFELTEDQLVYAELSDNSCDLDLFLLDDCDPSRNIAWDDAVIASELPAGGYFLVVDGHAGAACSYTLDFIACSGCVIDSVCYDDAETNPGNVCEICDISLDRLGWSANDGASCDDGEFCTDPDVCSGGVCTAGPARDCDDGEFCTGAETCDEINDECVSAGDPCTDDGLWCNGAESCDETGDACVHEFDDVTTFRCPDDGLFCDGTESCDETTDACVSSGDPCDVDETCDETTDTCVPNTDDDTAVDDDSTDDDTAVDDDAIDDDMTDDDVTDDDVTDDDVTDDDATDDDSGGAGGGGGDDDSGCGC